MISAARDVLTSKAAKVYVNKLIARYGRVDELKIDSKRKRIEVVCRLNGEVAPISVTIEKYRLETRGPKTVVQVLESSSNREWLRAVMEDHLHSRSFDVPAWAASAL